VASATSASARSWPAVRSSVGERIEVATASRAVITAAPPTGSSWPSTSTAPLGPAATMRLRCAYSCLAVRRSASGSVSSAQPSITSRIRRGSTVRATSSSCGSPWASWAPRAGSASTTAAIAAT
jgi:hypothetical protein